MSLDHFQGKNVADHLRDARLKGSYASSEMHGSELPGHLTAAAESAKETAALLLFLATLGAPLFLMVLLSLAWTIWKGGRSAIAGWAKLERLHRVIEEERYEIEHHRQQEKEELIELYRAKGFEGRLLDEAVEVLMADDNRLLKVMLEEELGLTLESYEHPLKQAVGAAVGALIAAALSLTAMAFWQFAGLATFSFLIVAIASSLSARFEKRAILPALVWNLALTFFCALILYLL